MAPGTAKRSGTGHMQPLGIGRQILQPVDYWRRPTSFGRHVKPRWSLPVPNGVRFESCRLVLLAEWGRRFRGNLPISESYSLWRRKPT